MVVLLVMDEVVKVLFRDIYPVVWKWTEYTRRYAAHLRLFLYIPGCQSSYL